MLLRASFVEMFFCTSFFAVNVDKMQAVFYRRCHTPSLGPYSTHAQSIIRADIKCLLLSQIIGPRKCAPEGLRVEKQTRRITQCHTATSKFPPAFAARK